MTEEIKDESINSENAINQDPEAKKDEIKELKKAARTDCKALEQLEDLTEQNNGSALTILTNFALSYKRSIEKSQKRRKETDYDVNKEAYYWFEDKCSAGDVKLAIRIIQSYTAEEKQALGYAWLNKALAVLYAPGKDKYLKYSDSGLAFTSLGKKLKLTSIKGLNEAVKEHQETSAPETLYFLANQHLNKNRNVALYLLLRAILKGSQEAAEFLAESEIAEPYWVELAEFYDQGIFIVKNAIKAAKYYQRAAIKGNKAAIDWIGKVLNSRESVLKWLEDNSQDSPELTYCLGYYYFNKKCQKAVATAKAREKATQILLKIVEKDTRVPALIRQLMYPSRLALKWVLEHSNQGLENIHSLVNYYFSNRKYEIALGFLLKERYMGNKLGLPASELSKLEYRLGALLLQKNPRNQAKTSVIFEELFYGKTNDRLDDAYDSFDGDGFNKALTKAQEELNKKSLKELEENITTEEKAQALGQKFLDNFKNAIQAQSQQNKKQQNKWEGNIQKKKKLKKDLNTLIKNKYKADIEDENVPTPTEDTIVNKKLVQNYLESRFEQITKRISPEEFEKELELLQSLVEDKTADQKVVKERLKELLKNKMKIKPGSISTLKLTDWQEVEKYLREKYQDLPIPDKATAEKEISSFMKEIDNLKVNYDIFQNYGEELDDDNNSEHEEATEADNQDFIRQLQDFYRWIKDGRNELPLYCDLPDKAKDNYYEKEINELYLTYTRDFLTFELATKQCDSSFIKQITLAQLPDTYKEFAEKSLINMDLFSYLCALDFPPKKNSERSKVYYDYNYIRFEKTKPKAKSLQEIFSAAESLLKGFKLKITK